MPDLDIGMLRASSAPHGVVVAGYLRLIARRPKFAPPQHAALLGIQGVDISLCQVQRYPFVMFARN